MRKNLTSYLLAFAAILLCVAVLLSATWIWLSLPLLYAGIAFAVAALVRFCWLRLFVE
jgi:hypothetical protein